MLQLKPTYGVCMCVSHVAKWRCEQTTDGKGLSIVEMWLLSLLLQGANKRTVKENVWECDSAHGASPGSLQISVAGLQRRECETLLLLYSEYYI